MTDNMGPDRLQPATDGINRSDVAAGPGMAYLCFHFESMRLTPPPPHPDTL